LFQFSQKQWVIDAGSLQVMEEEFIPPGAILTPNFEEYCLLFGVDLEKKPVEEKEKTLAFLAQKHHAVFLTKEDYSLATDSRTCFLVGPGNKGLEKGGMGDVLAGLAVALAGQKPALEAAATALFVSKKAAHELYREKGPFFNADDLADKIPFAIERLLKQ
jgi:NAD(P)H-hydrate repair Nnr-like enzyme with NAD(P)H-hydrate dehydratase domain